jgi:putative membrane protein
MWLLLLIVVAAVIYLVIKSMNKYSRMAFAPIDALKVRYSRGEITRDEYEQMKKDLES